MARILRNLRVQEVSSVDRGAGKGVKILLMKRDGAQPAADNVIDFEKLKASVRKEVNFDQALENIEVAEGASDYLAQAREAMCALEQSVCSILYDDDLTDKQAAITETFAQYQEHMAGLVPAKMEKAMTVTAEVQKQIDDAVSGAITKAATAHAEALAFANMPDSHKQYAVAKAMSEDEKKKFAAKAAEERDAEMKAKPVEKAAVVLPVEVQKQLDQAAEDRKVLKALQEKDEIATFAKRATGLGLVEADGEVMRKAYSGDAAAQVELDKKIAALTAQAKTGAVFKEFGDNTNAGGKLNAMGELNAKAAELRKADPKLTEAQAFTKAYTDPANAEIVGRHKQEEISKRAAA